MDCHCISMSLTTGSNDEFELARLLNQNVERGGGVSVNSQCETLPERRSNSESDSSVESVVANQRGRGRGRGRDSWARSWSKPWILPN